MNNSKKKNVVHNVEEGLAESSSVYVEGYSDSSMLSTGNKAFIRQEEKRLFNDSNLIQDICYIKALYQQYIRIDFDIQNAKFFRNEKHLELVLENNVKVIITNYFYELERLPNVILLNSVVLTGEEFLCFFAPHIYQWYAEIRGYKHQYIQQMMSDIVKKANTIQNKYIYKERTQRDLSTSPFWDSLHIVDNGGYQGEALSQFAHDEHHSENELHHVKHVLYEEIDSLQDNVNKIQQLVEGAKESSSYAQEANIGARLHNVEERVITLSSSVDTMNSMIQSLQTSYAKIGNLDIVTDELQAIKHAISLLNEAMAKISSGNSEEKLHATLTSYTESIQNELHALRSYVDTVNEQGEQSLVKGDSHPNIQRIETRLAEIVTKLQHIQTELVHGIQPHMHIEDMQTKLNDIKTELDTLNVQLEESSSQQQNNPSALLEEHIGNIHSEINTIYEDITLLEHQLQESYLVSQQGEQVTDGEDRNHSIEKRIALCEHDLSQINTSLQSLVSEQTNYSIQNESLVQNVQNMQHDIDGLRHDIVQLQSSQLTQQGAIETIPTGTTFSAHQQTEVRTVSELQTWIQYIKGLPDGFSHDLTVVGVEYNGEEQHLGIPFNALYGICMLSSHGELHYTPYSEMQFKEGQSYSEKFICTIKNAENVYLSITFSILLFVTETSVQAGLQPIIHYLYLHNEHGLTVDIQIRNPAVGDRLYSVLDNEYQYNRNTDTHYIFQGIMSIDESESLVHQLYIAINPQAMHTRYILVHSYGYIAGIEYNNSEVYTISCKEGVLEYPLLSQTTVAPHTPSMLPHEEPHHEHYAVEAGQESDIYTSEDANTVSSQEEPALVEEATDSFIEGEEPEGTYWGSDEHNDSEFNGIAYQEHAPYQDEAHQYTGEYPQEQIGQESEYNRLTSIQDGLEIQLFAQEEIAEYASTHRVAVSHCCYNGSYYYPEEVWESRYGIVTVYANGLVQYRMNQDVQHGLFYSNVYDIFQVVAHDEHANEFTLDVAFELYSTDEGVVCKDISLREIPAECIPPSHVLSVEGHLDVIENSDCLLMVETYTKEYMYTQDMHTVKVCTLSTMEEIEDFKHQIVLYIQNPDENVVTRNIQLITKGYCDGEYLSTIEEFTVIPEVGKYYYYYTDFRSDIQESSGGDTLPDNGYQEENEEEYENDLYTTYAEYDNGDSNTIDSYSDSQEQHVNANIHQENVFTVEDALMCKRISSKDIRLSGITGDAITLLGEGWHINNHPHKVYLQGCVYNTYGITSREGDYTVFIPENVHVTHRK